MWAFQTYGPDTVPDIVTVAKPMGNGHPVGAVITTPQIAASFEATGVEYFNTYGGNPVSCAIASAVLDVIENEKLIQHADFIGNILVEGARELAEKYEIIGDVRGRGLFFGIDLVKDRQTREPHTAAAEHICAKLMKQDKILLQSDGPYNNVLKFKSPMVFSEENAKQLLNALDETLAEITKS